MSFYLILTILYLLVLGGGFLIWRRGHGVSATVLWVVSLGLLLAAAASAAGAWVASEPALRALGATAAWTAGLTLPFLVVVAMYEARLANARWATSRAALGGAWAVAVIIAVVAMFVELIGRPLAAAEQLGSVLYVATPAPPPVAGLITFACVAAIGYGIQRAAGWPAVAAGGAAALLAALIGTVVPAGTSSVLARGGELIAVVALWVTELRLWRRPDYDAIVGKATS